MLRSKGLADQHTEKRDARFEPTRTETMLSLLERLQPMGSSRRERIGIETAERREVRLQHGREDHRKR